MKIGLGFDGLGIHVGAKRLLSLGYRCLHK
jgi:hypothetical protein